MKTIYTTNTSVQTGSWVLRIQHVQFCFSSHIQQGNDGLAAMFNDEKCASYYLKSTPCKFFTVFL